jgi:Asp-tRNA(Asn)/Glu-tRNA(Gln) amidotransferase A subunit family amidase
MTHSRKTDFSTVRGQVELVRKGALTSEEIVKDCLSAIDATDSKIGAWKHLDSEYALSQAKSLDEIRRTGQPTGDLHGIPVGVKDIFDTADMPTERGSVVYAGRNPESDSAVVEKLREEGAVVLGKTATTEFAYMDPATCSIGYRQSNRGIDHTTGFVLRYIRI